MSSAEDLPSKVDVIVLGTGVTESILAAACARVGKAVLHLDHQQIYGSMFASCSFTDLQQLLNKQSEDPSSQTTAAHDSISSELKSDETSELDQPLQLESTETFKPVQNLDIYTDVEIDFKSEDDEWSLEKFQKLSRRFNLDISPKLMFARGKMVDLFISANICKYTDFKLTTRVLTYLKNGQLEQVPCSRSDVFSTKVVNVVEKRALMKLMTKILDSDVEDTFQEWLEKPFSEFLQNSDFHLTPNLRHYIVNSIAMCNPDDTALHGLTSAKRFLQSLGRYGNSPFLTPIYGNGEIAQSFCRLCAVFGGVYHLNRKVEGFLTENDTVVGIQSGGQRFISEFVVTNVERTLRPVKVSKSISRAIVIAKTSMLPAEKEQISLLRIPGTENTKPITVIEMGHDMRVCPEGVTVAHLTCESHGETAKSDLSEKVERLYPSGNLLWVAYFKMPDTTSNGDSFSKMSINEDMKNIYTVSTPGTHLDYDFHVEEARKIFGEMYADEEFLPRAPDPEEIILDYDDQTVALEKTDNEENERVESSAKETVEENDAEAARVEESSPMKSSSEDAGSLSETADS